MLLRSASNLTFRSYGIFVTRRITAGYLEQGKRYAGHAHWQNIKHIKAAKDQQKHRNTTEFINRASVIIRETGNSNPDSNSKLSALVKQARSLQLTDALIKRTLDRLGKRSEAPPALVEAKGPGGSAMIIESQTGPKFRNNIQAVLKRVGGSAMNATARYAFEEKGLVEVEPGSDAQESSPEVDYEEIAISAECEDVVPSVDLDGTDLIRFVCDVKSLASTRTQIESLLPEDHQIKYAGVGFVPTMLRPLSERDMKLADKMMERFRENPDILRIYSNIDFDSASAES